MPEKVGKRAVAQWLAFVAAVAFVVVLRQVLFADLPIFVRGSTSDDQLMMAMASGLIEGDWLGPYAACTLMKGSFYPMLVSATHAAGIPYIAALTALHTAACLFFVSQMRFVIRNRWLLFVLLVVLLFDPAALSCRSFQAIYRNSITAMQVLVIFGAVFGLWLDYGDKRWKDIARAVIAGLAIWAFANTREDAAWVLPFVVVGLALVVAKAVRAFANDRKVRRLVAGVAITILPFALIFAGNAYVVGQNEARYGEAIRLECSDGSFADAMRSIYAVKDPVDLQYVSVSREKLERLYEASPALRSIRADLDRKVAQYSGYGRFSERGEVEDGWFLWALRYAAFEAGAATTLQDSQDFYGRVHVEIEAALDAGMLERQPTMPSALMSPWREGYAGELLASMPRAIAATETFHEAEALALQEDAPGSEVIMRSEDIVIGTAVTAEDAGSAEASSAAASARRANAVIGLYRALNPALAICAAAAFVVLAAISVARRRAEHIPFFLVVFGMALSAIVLFVGISYTEITAFTAIRNAYLAGAYPLALSCTWMTMLYCLEVALGERARSRTHNPHAVPE